MSRLGAYLFLLFLFSLSNKIKGQEISGNYIGGSLNYGIALPHTNTIKYSLDSKIYGLELTYSLKTNNKDYWDILYRKPNIGFGYYFGNFGGDEVYGHHHAAYSFFEASILKINNYKLSYGLNLGISYVPKNYNAEENPLNIAIGSHINAFAKFSLVNSFQLTNKLMFFQNISLMHLSNGNVISPNLGLNQFAFSTGIKYLLQSQEDIKINEIKPDFKKIYFDFFIGAGIKGLKHYIDGSFFAYTVNATILYRTSMKRSFGIGIDYFYDSSLNELERLFLVENIDTTNLYRMGVHFQNDIRYKKFIISLQLGYYFYNKHDKVDEPIYEQLGLKYLITENLYITINMKTHYTKADIIHWGFGLNF